MAEVAQGVVALIPSARGFSDLLHKEIGGGLTKAGEKGGEAYGKGMKGKVSGLAKGVFAPMLAAGSTVAIAGLLKSSVGEAREAQKVGAITSQIIKSTGGAAKVTSDQVGSLSEKLSLKSGVDDEVIQSGANMLLTFKQVRNEVGKGNDIFDRATAAANDLSAAGFGDMAGQSKMLGKALNDPIKGMSALSRSGVTFTAQQQKKIKSLVAEGKQLEAQKIMLKEVESQVGGTAEAQATAGDKAQVAWGNLQETIGTGLLPVIDKMQTVFTEKIAPAVSSFVQGMQDGSGAGGTFVTRMTQVKNILVAVGGFLVEHRTAVLAMLAAYAAYKVAAATVRAFNAVMAVARGLKLGYAIATGTATAATKANTVAEKVGLVVGKAKLIFTKAVTIATKAWAVAQRVLNAVLRMNPIGLVVTALIALGAGLVIAYKKSETFRRIVDAAWAGVKRAAQATVDWFVKTAWPVLKKIFAQIGAVATWLWKNAMAPAFRGIGAVISWWYKNVVKRYFTLVGTILRGAGAVAMWLWKNAFAPAFRGIAAVASWLWGKVLKPVFGRIVSGAKVTFGWIKNTGWPWMRDAFQAIGDKAKWMWDKGVKTPLNRMKAGFAALTTAAVGMKDSIVKQFGLVRDGIQKPLRQVMTFIDKRFISKVKGMLHGVGLGSLSVKIPYLTPGGKGYARGGILPGFTPMRQGDDVLTPMRSGEGVLVSEGLRDKQSQSMFLAANAAAKRGTSFANFLGQGYAKGGMVYPKMVDWLNRSVPGAVVTSTKRNWGGTSFHETGKAIDIGGSAEVMRSAASAIQRSFGSKIAELIHNPGFSVKNGQKVPSSFWGGSTWGAHANHVHWAMQAMSGKGGDIGGLGGMLSGFAGKVMDGGKKTLTDILDKIPGAGSFWGKTAIAPMKMVAGGVFDKFKAAASMMDGGGEDSGGKPGKGVERWRPTVLRALDILGMSDKYANSTLRRMMQESGGNPRAINNWDSNASRGTPSKGLMQVIDPTFRAYARQGYSKDIYDPLSNILASMRYAVATYGNLFNAYDRKGGYSGGGIVTPPVFDNGGTLAPGLNLVNNKLGKPEALVRPEQMGRPQVNISFAPGTEWLAEFVQSEITYASDFDRAIGRAV